MQRLSFLIIIAALCAAAFAQDPKPKGGFSYPPTLDGAAVETYKEIDGAKLNVWIFQPDGKATPGAKRPAIVFFFGGGWTSGSPAQFERQCRHFAERGMVAITADYRVASRQPPRRCRTWMRREKTRK